MSFQIYRPNAVVPSNSQIQFATLEFPIISQETTENIDELNATDGTFVYDSIINQLKLRTDGNWEGVVTVAATQSLTNKTLNYPLIVEPIINSLRGDVNSATKIMEYTHTDGGGVGVDNHYPVLYQPSQPMMCARITTNIYAGTGTSIIIPFDAPYYSTCGNFFTTDGNSFFISRSNSMIGVYYCIMNISATISAPDKTITSILSPIVNGVLKTQQISFHSGCYPTLVTNTIVQFSHSTMMIVEQNDIPTTLIVPSISYQATMTLNGSFCIFKIA